MLKQSSNGYQPGGTVQFRIPGAVKPYSGWFVTPGEAFDYTGITAQSLRGMDGILDDLTEIGKILFDKPDSWYVNLNRLQNDYSIMNAELNGIGKGPWDSVVGKVAVAPFDSVQKLIKTNLASIVVTGQYVPHENTIARAQNEAVGIRAMLDVAKAAVPAEIAMRSNQWATEMAIKVANIKLKSPGEAGKKEFIKELDKRASALGGTLFDWTKYAAIGAVAVGGIILLSRFGGPRRNPRSYSDNLFPFIMAGGAAGLFYILTKEKKPGVASGAGAAAGKLPGAPSPTTVKDILANEEKVSIGKTWSGVAFTKMTQELVKLGVPFAGGSSIAYAGPVPMPQWELFVPASLAGSIRPRWEELTRIYSV